MPCEKSKNNMSFPLFVFLQSLSATLQSLSAIPQSLSASLPRAFASLQSLSARFQIAFVVVQTLSALLQKVSATVRQNNQRKVKQRLFHLRRFTTNRLSGVFALRYFNCCVAVNFVTTCRLTSYKIEARVAVSPTVRHRDRER